MEHVLKAIRWTIWACAVFGFVVLAASIVIIEIAGSSTWMWCILGMGTCTLLIALIGQYKWKGVMAKYEERSQ